MRLYRALAGISAITVVSLATAETTVPLGTYEDRERSYWAYQPRSQPAVPTFDEPADRSWTENPVDAFILERLRKEALRPAPPADRITLIRRVCFDLTGLPPAPDEVEAFVNDSSTDAWDKLVERLLASPRYGERWGQHWLDVVRFAESDGFEYDRHRPDAWRYRDYVIRSFNEAGRDDQGGDGEEAEGGRGADAEAVAGSLQCVERPFESDADSPAGSRRLSAAG